MARSKYRCSVVPELLCFLSSIFKHFLISLPLNMHSMEESNGRKPHKKFKRRQVDVNLIQINTNQIIPGADETSGSSMFSASRSAMGSLLRIDTRGSRGNSDIELERGANYNCGA